MTQQHDVTWGALDLGSKTPTADGYLVEALSKGTSLGNPQPVIEVVKSLLADGSLAVIQNWDNREAPIRLRLSAPVAIAGPALAAAEKAIFAQVLMEQRPPLVWVPPAGDAATCVFDVVVARLDRDTDDGWDEAEAGRECRYYLLTLICLPFARPENTVVATALPLPPTPGGTPVWVDIDTCGSVAGWTRETNGSTPSGPTFVLLNGESAIRVTAGISHDSQHLRLVRTGAVVVPANNYLVVDAYIQTLWPGVWRAHIDGVSTAPVAILPEGGEGGSDRLFFEVGSFNELKVLWDFSESFGLVAEAQLVVANVATTDTLGDTTTSTARQQSRIIPVGGSAPTQAAIRVYTATPAALGTDILIYTSRNINWRPPLRRWLVSSSAVVADTAMVSGGRHTLAASTVYEFPASLLKAGTFALLARLSISIAGTLTWSARMVNSAGATTVGSSQIVTGSVALAATSGYEVLTLGSLILPVVEVEGDQKVELTLTGTGNMSLDEGWLFGLDDGALTWLRDADGLAWAEVRSPQLDSARPAVFGGTGAFGNNPVCVDWKCRSFGTHEFDPAEMLLFTVTSTSLAAQSELEFYRRYHSHVIDES